MRQSSKRVPDSAEKTVRDIRRATRRHHSAEDKIRIVLEGLRGEDSIAELCRKEGINQNLYYRWSKEFLEAGKKRLAGDTAREATTDEVKELKAEARQLGEEKGKKGGMGRRVSEKFEIIELVEQSPLSIRRHSRRSGSRDRRSTNGTAVTRTAGSKLWRMASRDRGGSGTRSLTRSGRRSSIWLLRSRICRRVSSPSTSRTRTAALCPRQAFIGS